MTLKTKLARRELTVGSWLQFGYTPVCEIMAQVGFEWLVVDMEHAPLGVERAFQLIQIIDLAGCTPLARVGDNQPLLIKQVMDAGAHGVIVPMVNNASDAQRAVQALYYPPLGSRGVGLARAHRYGLGFDDYKTWLQDNAVLIVQIEHIQAVENLEAILAVDGVDGFMIGPYDLSGSLNLPGEFENARVKEALARVGATMRGSAKPGGFHVVHSDPAALAQRIDQGYRFIAYGTDMVFFSEKIRAETAAIAQFIGDGR